MQARLHLKHNIEPDGVLMTQDPEIHSGDVVFKGTRLPVQTFIDHLEDGYSIQEFHEDFPSATLEQLAQVKARLFDE